MNNRSSPFFSKAWLRQLLTLWTKKPPTREQLIALLYEAKELELLDQDGMSMIEGVLKVSEMKVRDIMIPRVQMVVVEHDVTPLKTLPVVIESVHSRFPVIVESRDEVIGILLAKDLLKYLQADSNQSILIKDISRPAVFVPESKRLNVLLKEFRLNRNHMAIVVDEYGSVSGLVTIEDVLEQIVGDIEDEYDIGDLEPNIRQISASEYAVKALTSIEEFNKQFGTHLNHENFDTIGGYIMQQFGHIPKRDESITIYPFQITVLLANKRCLQLFKLTKINKNTSP